MIAKRITASVALGALVLGLAAAPALAEGNAKVEGKASAKVSESFGDMGDFGWGLGDVTKMTLKGVFKGRAEGLFAPGAKITRQESAVATVRLMGKESDAQAMAEADVAAQLAAMPDREKLAAWARQSVALLVKAGAVSKTEAFRPDDEATRLEIAVLLVKAMGYETEAMAKMDAALSFKDADRIPAELRGYVAAAVDHQLITGYEDLTFRPNQAVKRVEMAVMLGRADQLIDKKKADEVRGVVQSVNATGNSFVMRVREQDMTLKLAANASVFVNGAEKAVADLQAGMKAEAKLNAAGEVLFVEAKSPKADARPQEVTVSGHITSLVAASGVAVAVVKIDGVAYPVAPQATILLDGQAAAFSSLGVGDEVKATVWLGVVSKLEAHRPVTVISGKIASMTAGTPNKLSLTSDTGVMIQVEYTVAANAEITLNGQASAFGALQVGDAVELAVVNGVAVKVTAIRTVQETVVTGTLVGKTLTSTVGLVAPVGVVGKVSVGNIVNGAFTMVTYDVLSTTQITLNGQAVTLAGAMVDDSVRAVFVAGAMVRLELTR